MGRSSGATHGPLKVHVQGEHNRENIMTAIAIGLHYGVTETAFRGRSHVPTGQQPVAVDLDPAQPHFTRRIQRQPSSMCLLTSFKRMTEESTTEGTPLCILGDMASSGAHTTAAHEEILAFAELACQRDSGPLFRQGSASIRERSVFGNTKKPLPIAKRRRSPTTSSC